MADKVPRAWQRMLSGRRLNLLDPSPLDVEVEDIAHGLSRVARWNGQTSGEWSFSVAQHSVLVEEIFSRSHSTGPQKWQLAALLHDAPEYVIGDMITPFKSTIGPNYRTIEAGLQSAVHIRFGLPAVLPVTIAKAIKRADRIAAFLEATQIAGFSEKESYQLFGRPGKCADLTVVPERPNAAKKRFLERFKILGGMRKNSP